MKSTFSLIVLVTSSVGIAFATSQYPVCIVGAGPTGLTVANGLESKGYSTVVFEKDPEVGGKCQSYYEGDFFHPMGALLFSNETYTETLPIILKSGLPFQPFAYTSKGWLFDWRTGVVNESPVSAADVYPLLKPDIDRYIEFWNSNIGPNLTTIGYKNGIPSEYTVSFSDWLWENQYNPELISIFEDGMVPYGYGDVLDTPAHPGYVIDRSGKFPIITYANPAGSEATQTCSKVILAFPPVSHALEAANLQLSAEEQEVFSPVEITKYWSGAIQVATPNGYAYSAVAFEPAGQLSAYLRLFDASPIATTWSWGKTGSKQTTAQAKKLLRSTISKFNKDPNNATEIPQPVTEEDVRQFEEWDYFPHYNTKDLEAGFYDKFNKLQGQQNTYYASGFNGFETVEFAIRAGQDIVATYF
ncbi:hypothetical protein PHLCEN_2v10147 [Hermanssonia centrifuga]|uniref:Amine oxidase domain-containing protein n=1 Tax=Hermanssonia centrifuga TaxID=98765 RepID=A0A2R6NNR5_9APHY|nr:hypothetical protein PHLCEN_2v10147 [Hermanssonia centrifuga]